MPGCYGHGHGMTGAGPVGSLHQHIRLLPCPCCARRAGAGAGAHSEGLVAAEDVAVQREAELAAVEERGIRLGRLAVCSPVQDRMGTRSQ